MYKYKDYNYSLEEVQDAADKEKLSIDEYIKEFNIQKTDPDPDEEGKETPSQEIESAAVKESVALEPTVTDSKPVTISLDLPKVKTGTSVNTAEVNKIKEKTTKELQAELKIINDRIALIAGKDMRIDALDSPNRIKEFNQLSIEKNKILKNLGQETNKGEGVILDLFNDLIDAAAQGYSRGDVVDPSFKLFSLGGDASDQQVLDLINAKKDVANKAMQSDEMRAFDETYEKAGGGFLGFMLGAAENPSVVPAMLISSIATQIGTVTKSEDARQRFAQGVIGGGVIGSSIPVIGTAAGAIGGGFFAAAGTMETALTFADLLEEEIGEELTVDNVRAILEDPVKLEDLQNRALGRGLAIATIETATGALAKGVGSTLVKKGFTPIAVTGSAAGLDVVGGGIGEVAGMTLAKQPYDIKEIGFEMITPGFSSAIGLASLRNITELTNQNKINKIIKPTEYTNISYAFDPIEQTTEAQINIAQIPGSEKILDRNVKREISKGNITQEQGDAIKLNFRETQGATNQIKSLRLNEQDQATAVQLIKEKKKLKNQIEQVGEPNLTIEQSDRIKQIDENLRGIKSKAVTQQVEKVREAAKDITDLDIQEFATTAETEAFLNEQSQDIKASSQQGFIIQNKDGKQTIVINREIADKEEAVAAPAHEFLHAILYKTVKDSPNTALQLGNSLMEYINKIDINQVKDSNFAQRLQQYQDQPTEVQAEEALTLFSDAILTGDIKFKENIFTKLRDIISKILQVGGVKVRFDTGRDVYNFIKDYNKNIQEGKLTSQQIRTAEEGVKLDIQDQAVEQAETIIKESKSLTPEVTTDAENRIVELQKLKKETTAAAESLGKEYAPSAREQRLQGELLNIIDPVVSKVAENRTKALYDKIPAEQKENVSREDYKESLKNNLATMAVNEFTQGKQDLEAFIVNRGYLRANSLAKELGIESTEEFGGPGITLDVAETADIAVEPTETAQVTPEQGKKLVSSILNKELEQEFKDTIANLNLTEEQLTFKTLPNAAIEVFAKAIGVPAKKFAGKANFTQAELGKVITAIENNIDLIRQVLPQAAVLEGAAVSEDLIGTATGVPNNLLNNPDLYTRKERTTKDAGLVPYEKNKGIDNTSILKAIGIIEGKRTAGPRDKQAQTAKGLINVLAKFATNQEVRRQKNLTPQQKTNIETGKGSRILFSKNISKEERNKRNKILINESTKAFKGNPSFDEYLKRIRPVLQNNKVTKALSDPKNKSFKGNIYEYYIWERLNSLNINGLKLMPPEYGTGTDIKATFFDQPFDLEVKLNLEDAFGAPTIYYDSGKNKWSFDQSNLDQETFDIVEKNIDQQKINNFLTEIQKLGAYSLDEAGNKKEKVDFTLRIPAESYKKNKNRFKPGKIDKLTASVYKKIAGKQLNKQEKQSLNNAIIEYYNKKGINYIVVDNQMYYLKENPLRLPINQLTGDVYIKFRIKPGSEKKNEKLGNFYNLMAATQFGMDKATSKGTPLNKAFQTELSKSISKAEIKNNKELPKKFQLPKGSTNEQVLAKMQELDDQANEARIKYSKSQNLDEAFNDIIEAKTGIETYKRFSPAKAAVRGASKGKFNFFIPPSAEDFVGLLYKTLAKGKVGDRQMQWYKDNLLDPYARAMNDISAARVAMFEDYKQLKKDLEVIPKDLKKKSVDEYTREQAVRVYIWNEQGNKIPGLFKTDQKQLVDYVTKDSELKLFADQLIAMQKNDDYSSPKEGWLTGSITTDLLESVNSIKRKKYLEQWQNNVDEIFSEVNMNKLEAAFGKPYRKALENILTRMKTGRNKPFRSDTLAGRVTDWLNNSVGAIMFFNTRSAVLQTISSINFVNWSDNNIYQAGKAFANQPQYWKDFKFLFNSDFLKERRGGLRFNVSESEIADMAKKGGARGVISKILQAGFLPTQAADSFAIASGGATFYRNRLNSYIKEGLTEAEAQEKAFQDFREIAEESQQSSRPDRISAQQAGALGRTILAFANTPAQYARLTKKAASDLINGRGDAKTNISKLLYYGAVQNLIFNTLQQAAFAVAFGDDDEDEKKKEEKYISVANGMADGLLRGIGVGGAVIATLKNALIKIIKESEKKRPDYAETAVIQLLGISPPIQSKAQKIRSALKSYEWNKKEMLEKGFSLDNPAYLAGANVISASTNIPLDRVIKKVDNVRAATRDDISKLERMMLLAGWSDWQLGIQPERKPKKKKKTRSSGRGTSRSNNRSSNRR